MNVLFSPGNFPYIFEAVLTICLLIGGFFAIRDGRQTKLTNFQKDTIDALKERISALEGKISDFEKDNIIQRHIIDTITSALSKEGIIITISGDLVSIENTKTGISQHRKRTITTQQSSSVTQKQEI